MVDEDPSAIVEGVRAVARGETWLSKAVATNVVEYAVRGDIKRPGLGLSLREAEVLRLVAQGWKNAQIAQALYVSVGTVKNHVTGLCRKVGTHSRSALVAWAWQQGLMDDR